WPRFAETSHESSSGRSAPNQHHSDLGRIRHLGSGQLMRKLLLIILLTLPTIAFAQTATVTGHVVLPSGTSPANAKVCVTLQNYQPNSPRVVGTGTVVQQTSYCFTPAADASFSTALYRNDSITPSGTFWRFDFMFGSIQQSSASYLVNASPFNLDNAT